MQPCARTFPEGIQAADARLPVQIHLDTAAEIVCRRRHRNVILRDIDADFQTMLVYVGEMPLRLLRILVCNVEIDMVVAPELHLAVYRAGYNIPRSQREPRVILLHEFLARRVAEHSPIPAHSLCNQEAWPVAGMIECRRVELYELHILHSSFRAVNHRNTVARSHERIGGVAVNSLATAGSHHSYL